MAKLEIPSIVVQSGTHTPTMDRSPSRTQWSLSTQSTYEEECEPVASSTAEEPEQPKAQIKEEEKIEPAPPAPTNNNILPRSRSKANLKLLKRSHAIKESTSPPPDVCLSPVNTPPDIPTAISSSNNNNNNIACNNNNGLNSRPSSIKREGSSQSIDSNWSSQLSRGNSIEQQHLDQSGIDIEQFIIDTLNKNTKDRIFLLRIENDLVGFAKDPRKTTYRFGVMTSYQRMLVHRVAHYFGMQHNVDSSGHMVVVEKGKNTRLPEVRFVDFTREDLMLSEEPRKSILKRDSASFEDTVSFKSPDRHLGETPRRSKSFEEREEEYEKARRRIFHQEQGDHNQDSTEDSDCSQWGPRDTSNASSWTANETSDFSKLHPNSNRPSRLTKVESYESRDTLRANSLRSSVSKSFSFGGYDQNGSNGRVLTKQDSGSSVSSRVSPSSSGYKSQSQRSDTTMSATPSPTATPHLATQLSNQSGVMSPEPEGEQPALVWAVTDISSVPPGSMLINPQTGKPVINDDGSIYRFDPQNPPKMSSDPHGSNHPYQNGETVDQDSSHHTHRDHHETRTKETSEVSEAVAPGPVPAPPCENTTYPETKDRATVPQPPVPSMPATTFFPLPQPSPLAMAPPHNLNQPQSGVHVYPYNTYPPSESAPNASMMYGIPPNPPSYATAVGSAAMVPGYDRIPVMEGGSQELCGYIMGLSLGEVVRPEASHRPVFYCPSAPAHTPANHPSGHFTQGAHGPVPLYLPHVPLVQQQGFPPGRNPYPANERSATDCNYTQPAVHAYFSRCPSSAQLSGAPNYCSTNNTAGSMMGLVQLPPNPLQQAPPTRPYHRMSTPPTTPQSGCPPYPMYSNGYAISSCYSHYQTTNPPSQLPIPPILRPGLQICTNVCPSPPPLRAAPRAPTFNNAARSPVIRESASSDSQSSPLRFTAPSPHTPIHMYRFTYPTNEVILLNTSRTTFTTSASNSRCPTSSAPPVRRQRPRPVGPSPANVLSLGAASQQQAALATAIEAAGLGVQTGAFHLMSSQ